MNALPAHIPRSLKSYLEQYQEDPDNTIDRLENHLHRRGPDAVGYYLLSWFHHFNGNPEEAVKCAWKAKIFAPGSPTMEQLHYYMTHPKKFKAWKPSKPVIKKKRKTREGSASHPISDLDSLISKLSSVDSKKIHLDTDAVETDESPDLSEESSMVEDIVTETLAGIYEKQGNKQAALDTYKRLMDIHTHKKGYYRKQIERLKEEIGKA